MVAPVNPRLAVLARSVKRPPIGGAHHLPQVMSDQRPQFFSITFTAAIYVIEARPWETHDAWLGIT